MLEGHLNSQLVQTVKDTFQSEGTLDKSGCLLASLLLQYLLINLIVQFDQLDLLSQLQINVLLTNEV
jgi:hypothetical protein